MVRIAALVLTASLAAGAQEKKPEAPSVDPNVAPAQKTGAEKPAAQKNAGPPALKPDPALAAAFQSSVGTWRCAGRRSKGAVAAYSLLHVAPDLRIIPGLRGLVHIILPEQLPERHDEGGGIVCLRAPEKLNNIVVIVGERKIMLEVGMAI